MSGRIRIVLALVVGAVSTGAIFWNLSGPKNPMFSLIPLEARTYDLAQGAVVNLLVLYSMAMAVGVYLGTFFVKGQPVRAGVLIGLCTSVAFFIWYNLALMPNPLILDSAWWVFELVFAVALALTAIIIGAAGALLAWGTVLVGREIMDMIR